MNPFNILGMILTVGASGALGLYYSSRMSFRADELLEFKKALLILKSEIEYAAAPLAEAMENISARVSLPVSAIFSDFAASLNSMEEETAYRLWLTAIARHKSASYLKPADWQQIEDFGKTLGYLDKQMQADAIRLITEYLDSEITAAQNDKNAKMYRSLGVIGGVLLVVLFW